MKPRSEDWVWAGVFATGIGYEVWAVRSENFDHTMSRMTRKWWRTQHPVGAVVFTVSWMGFAAWFAYHVVKGSMGNDQWVQTCTSR